MIVIGEVMGWNSHMDSLWYWVFYKFEYNQAGVFYTPAFWFYAQLWQLPFNLANGINVSVCYLGAIWCCRDWKSFLLFIDDYGQKLNANVDLVVIVVCFWIMDQGKWRWYHMILSWFLIIKPYHLILMGIYAAQCWYWAVDRPRIAEFVIGKAIVEGLGWWMMDFGIPPVMQGGETFWRVLQTRPGYWVFILVLLLDGQRGLRQSIGIEWSDWTPAKSSKSLPS
jgi:hypothetical protein